MNRKAPCRRTVLFLRLRGPKRDDGRIEQVVAGADELGPCPRIANSKTFRGIDDMDSLAHEEGVQGLSHVVQAAAAGALEPLHDPMEQFGRRVERQGFLPGPVIDAQRERDALGHPVLMRRIGKVRA